MSILPLVFAPSKTLLSMSEPVEKVDDSVRKLMDDMFETMYHFKGVGLSAVQVNTLLRVIVVDVDYTKGDEDGEEKPEGFEDAGKRYYMANPKVIKKSEELSEYDEGCLSFPNENVLITRPSDITVSYLDYNGEGKTLEATGLLSTCIQHEIDHMNGVVITSYLSKLRRDMMIKRLKKRQREYGDS